MRKIITILFIIIVLTTNTFAAQKSTSTYKAGKGPLKLTEDMANILEYFFSGGKMGYYKDKEKQKNAWKPGIIAVSIDGREYHFFRHPWNVDFIDNKNYGGIAISECKKRSGTNCFVFANGYKIVWDNGSDKKKRRLKKRDIKAGKTLQILQELGFYDGSTETYQSTTEKEETKKKKITKKKKKKITGGDADIVEKIKELNELYKSGILTKEEFEKAKKKLLN